MLSSIPTPTAPVPADAFEIQTSGTLSSHRRAYFYQRPQFDVIQAHHWWRIERELGLERPGVVVGFAYNPLYAEHDGRYYQVVREGGGTSRRLDRPADCFYGPSARRSVGTHNRYHEWQYSRHATPADWEAAWEHARGLCPKVVQLLPSQLQAAWPAWSRLRPMGCPVVMTSEVLDAVTREMAATLFTKVVDKMRCWDGGLGFFECRVGRKHVYDELAYVEEVGGTLVSTDLFNFVHPFLRYANGDDATLADGGCRCGVYGRYFVEFRGRICQRVVLGSLPVPGRAIAEDVMRFLTYGYLPSALASEAFRVRHPSHPFADTHVRWQLYQRPDLDFEFRYAGDLTPEQVACLDEAARFIVLRQGDLPRGGLDAAVVGQRLETVRCDDLGGKAKNLSVISEAR